MKKTIEITQEQAVELLKTTPSLTEIIYSNFPELKPKKRWFEEYKGGNIGVFDGNYTGSFRHYDVSNRCFKKSVTFETNVQASQHAKKLNLYTEMQVFANFRNGYWVEDWCDKYQKKYGIDIYYKELKIKCYETVSSFVFNIAVKNTEIAQEMLEEFGERIKECFNLK